MTAMNEETYWQSLSARDARADGTFVYAVRSTGIYCRPSCPSRRPRREHIVFFPLPAAAERAGFRACRRCRPREADDQARRIRRLCRYIETHLDHPLTLVELGAQASFSPHHLQRLFKRIVGVTPRQYAEACRLGQLKTRLKDGPTVAQALYEAGYGSSRRLYEQADRLGMTPAAYRRGGSGVNIIYTTVDCALGRLLVAATEKGICFVSLGDSDAFLQAELARDYPAAEIQRDQAGLGRWVSAILKHLDGRQPHLDLPLDVQGTAFQWQVWEALRAIPYGATRSYGEIARSLGKPQAARAVARACAGNPASIVIPCHRAVGQDGDLTGYRWGVERKRALLVQEGAPEIEASK